MQEKTLTHKSLKLLFRSYPIHEFALEKMFSDPLAQTSEVRNCQFFKFSSAVSPHLRSSFLPAPLFVFAPSVSKCCC